MKKLFAIILCLLLVFAICSCSNNEATPEETTYNPATYSFHDIYFELTDEWNYKSVKEMQSTGIELYDELSRSDMEGFVDEYVLVNDNVAPTFIYCFDAPNFDINIAEYIEYSKGEAPPGIEYEVVTINGIDAAKATEIIKDNNDTFYYIEIMFFINERAYSLYTMGSNELNPDGWLNTIINSIDFY